MTRAGNYEEFGLGNAVFDKGRIFNWHEHILVSVYDQHWTPDLRQAVVRLKIQCTLTRSLEHFTARRRRHLQSGHHQLPELGMVSDEVLGEQQRHHQIERSLK